jgi:integral membrane sensor domain MASE1
MKKNLSKHYLAVICIICLILYSIFRTSWMRAALFSVCIYAAIESIKELIKKNK